MRVESGGLGFEDGGEVPMAEAGGIDALGADDGCVGRKRDSLALPLLGAQDQAEGDIGLEQGTQVFWRKIFGVVGDDMAKFPDQAGLIETHHRQFHFRPGIRSCLAPKAGGD